MRWMLEMVAGAGWGPIAVAALAACAVALVGGLATDTGPWYRNLAKPSWQPPDWAFGPAWTLIFTLSAWAGVLAWNRAPDEPARLLLVGAFALNGVLNAAWSVIFFAWRRPDWALVEVVALWLSIALLIVVAGAIAPLAGWLLVPYLLWVSFASFLNFTIVRLNRPFPARVPA